MPFISKRENKVAPDVLPHKLATADEVRHAAAVPSYRSGSSELTCGRPQDRPALQIAPEQITDQSPAGICSHVLRVTSGSRRMDRRGNPSPNTDNGGCKEQLRGFSWPMRFKHLRRALASWRHDRPIAAKRDDVGWRRGQSRSRAVDPGPRGADGAFPRWGLFLLLRLSRFKGKENGGPRAPKLRNYLEAGDTLTKSVLWWNLPTTTKKMKIN